MKSDENIYVGFVTYCSAMNPEQLAKSKNSDGT